MRVKGLIALGEKVERVSVKHLCLRRCMQCIFIAVVWSLSRLLFTDALF